MPLMHGHIFLKLLLLHCKFRKNQLFSFTVRLNKLNPQTQNILKLNMRGRATLMPCASFSYLILQCQHVKIMLSPCSCAAVAFGGFLENSKPSGPALCFKGVGLLYVTLRF